jgi:membrane fusion protein, multidrug efflux system
MSQQASRAGVFTVSLSRVLVGGLMAVAIAALSAGCREATKAAAAPPPTVEVELVTEKDVPIYGEWVGTTVGYVTAQIRARASGYLMRQNYNEGTLVKAGDVLFEIDARTYQLAERQAGAALRLVESQLEQANAQVAQAEADLARAEATQKRSELDVARYAPLAGSGAVTQQEVDNAVQTDSANVAMVKAAAANVANTKAGVSRTQADIERLRAALADAQLNTSWTKLISPITGIAGIKNANIGDLIETSTPLTTVSQVDPIYVQFPVSEQEYLRLRQRGPVDGGDRERQYDLEITLADGASYHHRGTVAILDRAVGQTTGTISIRGVFPNPGDLLRPGQYAKVRAVIDTKKGALLIPQRAVQDLQGVHQVAVVGADEIVDLRKVQVGERVGPLWIVEQGLKPGERVVVEGLDKVKAGAKVTPTVAESRQSSALPAHGHSK